jgi:hypothetical protein
MYFTRLAQIHGEKKKEEEEEIIQWKNSINPAIHNTWIHVLITK